MKAKKSIFTEELQQDLYAWLDDLEATGRISKVMAIENICFDLNTIRDVLPKFVYNWTVEELIQSIMDR